MESYIYFLGKAWATSKETLGSFASTRHRRLGPRPGPAGFGLGLSTPPPCHDPSVCGQPQPGPRSSGLVQLGWGSSTKDGWSV